MGRKAASARRHARSNPSGVLSATAGGFGFVETPEGSFFIPASKMGGAFDGDVVELAVAPSSSKKDKSAAQGPRAQNPQARVVRVLHRAHETVIGRLEVADPFAVVVPCDPRIHYDIFTMRRDAPDIPEGSIVRVRMLEYPSRRSAATGVVEEVLGQELDDVSDIEMLIGRYKLESRFSSAALAQAQRARVDVDGALAAGYRDLREEFIFTIDPQDARDFDDAVSLEVLPSGNWRLGVHIADVSHYVAWNSPLDSDARRRATSVYLVDRVLPMLPEELSNAICSLVPGEARLCLSVQAELDGRGKLLSSECFPSVIQSKARLSYERALCYIQAAEAGAGLQEAALRARQLPLPQGALPLDAQACERLFEVLPQLARLARCRAALRKQAGGVDFESVEAKVVLDEDGVPIAIKLRGKNAATSAIEEAMLLANECVAQRLQQSGTPAIFRCHEAPSPESLQGNLAILQEYGYFKDISQQAFVAGDPFALQALLACCQGRSEAPLVNQLLLRSMKRALYSPRCTGHFALASQAYCHFTSPIRRYPDLVVHRMLKRLLGFGGDEDYGGQLESLEWLSQHSSDMERVAESAARESQELKMVEYMGRYVGMVLPGIVSGVATYGLYVQLENTVEGLLPMQSLGPDYFSYDPVLQQLNARDSGRSYRLGQRIRVRIHAAPPHARRLELRLP